MPLLDDPWLPAPDGDGNIPSVRAAAPVAVYRYDGSSTLAALPNVECLWIEHREGTDPGHAGFRYNLASGLSGAPATLEEALGTGSSGPYIVEAGDRLVVQALRPDGVTAECLFDGYALDFGMRLDPDSEEVPIGAVGVAWRCWDTVIGGAIFRDASLPMMAGSGSDVPTYLVAHFNEEGRPNCIPDGAMSGSAGPPDRQYPVFLDPLVVRSPDIRTNWTLPKAVRYILFTQNAAGAFVANPDGSTLDALLKDPAGNPIAAPDAPITGKDWPGTVCRLVRECGFGMNFQLSTDGGGLPVTTLNLFAANAGTPKSIYLGSRGSAFSPTTFNFNASAIHRDLTDVVNVWQVVGARARYEVSVVLMPGFPMASADASNSSIPNYDKSNAANRDAYRLYVFDETGEGRYAFGSATVIRLATSLDAVFGAPITVGGVTTAQYAHNRRRPIGTLISRDAANLPRQASLSISTDYAGAKPGLWDGTGQWQVITSTTWQLLPDRLGVRITDKNPEKWEIGKGAVSGDPFPAGVVHGVSAQATAAAGKNFYLRLTCVIESDACILRSSGPGLNSPLPQSITRLVDARDRYRYDVIQGHGQFNSSSSNLTARDDSALALAEASALQAGTAAGVLDGPVVIPRLTTYYKVGDRITSIEGRGLGLRTDQGTGTPIYPVVVGVRHDLGDRQTTTLEISDAGTDRRRYLRKAGRPKPPRARGARGMSGEGGGGLAGPAKDYSASRRFADKPAQAFPAVTTTVTTPGTGYDRQIGPDATDGGVRPIPFTLPFG